MKFWHGVCAGSSMEKMGGVHGQGEGNSKENQSVEPEDQGEDAWSSLWHTSVEMNTCTRRHKHESARAESSNQAG
jgi:hypothetical protein